MPSVQIMKIRQVSFEYIGKDEDIDLFFKAAICDYFKAGNVAKDEGSTFGGCVENLINKGKSENISSFV